MSTFKPTFLYIKQHSKTGLLYFGKTTKRNLLAYCGSGQYWKRHIDKHGKEYVETLWYCLYLDLESLKSAAEQLSVFFDVALSESWANLKPETGVDGGSSVGYSGFKGKKHTPEHIAKIKSLMLVSHPNKGKRFSDDVRQRMSAANTRPMLGKSHSDTTKQKISDRLSGRQQSDQERAMRRRVSQTRTQIYSYAIQTPDGIQTTTNLRKWCSDNNIDYSVLGRTLKSQQPHKKTGFMLLSKVRQNTK